VHCLFTVRVPVEVPGRVRELRVLMEQKIDEMESLARPRFALPERLEIKEGASVRVAVRNVSLAWAHFDVAVVGGDGGVTTAPTHGTVLPGAVLELTVSASRASGDPAIVMLVCDKVTIAAVEVSVRPLDDAVSEPAAAVALRGSAERASRAPFEAVLWHSCLAAPPFRERLFIVFTAFSARLRADPDWRRGRSLDSRKVAALRGGCRRVREDARYRSRGAVRPS